MNTKEALAGLFGQSVEDLEAREPFTLEFKRDEISATVDTYHWLERILSYESRYDKIFQRLARRSSEPWFRNGEEFAQKMKDKRRHCEGPHTCFTANHQTMLSEDVLFTHFVRDWESLVVLQIHHGGDPRNDALSAARVFSCDDSDIFRFSTAMIGATWGLPENQLILPGIEMDRYKRTGWLSEDGGYQWSWDGDMPLRYRPNELKDYEMTEDPEQRGKGLIYIDPEGVGYCPILGEPLNLWQY